MSYEILPTEWTLQSRSMQFPADRIPRTCSLTLPNMIGAAMPFERNTEILAMSELRRHVYKVISGAVRTYPDEATVAPGHQRVSPAR